MRFQHSLARSYILVTSSNMFLFNELTVARLAAHPPGLSAQASGPQRGLCHWCHVRDQTRGQHGQLWTRALREGGDFFL